MTAISGRKLGELLQKSGPTGSFLKTLLDCSPFWSRRVYLKWKSKRLSFFVRTVNRKQTPQSSASSEESLEALLQKLGQQDIYYPSLRMAHQSFCVFQLAPLTHRTAGTEPGLLPTPNTVQIPRMVIDKETLQVTELMRKDGKPRQRSIRDALLIMAAQHGLIPTVTAMDSTQSTAKMRSAQVKEDSMHSMTLSRLIALLPTPTARDWKGPQAKDYQGKESSLPGTVKFLAGMNGPLNPRFVAEMMGFPANWTELPFRSGGTQV
ncbi:hypothetical protein Mucpa_2325 [Mucilaginibacter paludis DSM 18603]|uniref:Uncharacterized protein n=1 Tax=Mucilaginibacter paludis DSM 18603 TaxID=714943 RepID=H1YHN2_9SPHI|nr:hypothetical protein Mucpa_2325 [Mucilaginibacter paludis DSM 18603]